MTWVVIQTGERCYHVLPSDERGHHADKVCLCAPASTYEWNSLMRTGGEIITHNAYDGRERWEDSVKTDYYADIFTAWENIEGMDSWPRL